ncbi:50S ribosomal protein L29 [Candidatus Woesearchaeota archaeon]|nr:50S ribosomal protein L29 [Candidatus Woesearchaeota archaeon]
MKKHQIKQMNSEQVEKKLFELRKELLRLNSQRASGTNIENPGAVKSIRKDIARMLTLKNNSLREVINKQ